jgi:hypothetical protein
MECLSWKVANQGRAVIAVINGEKSFFAQIYVESLCAIRDYRSVGMFMLLLSAVNRIRELYSPEYG